ncbi:Topoisomerase DNA-binding C4 zinc finger domain-containing protein [Sulfidibacter corallicola]|uniref:Topoisomerase DNA-binding C4 zinc finger domain-containing protein n=1 Tax=Sulfidibacter corallicola TaxID=2818388 RepID=A0A8A4TJS4_SULCO|nr:hypothetical protein [Sulfidibacter corallicola]QTD49800.1 topoisomerase DNA-binding C4 zinc finger domain-containing protein [Sulfidibacter corallicola]
MEPRPWYTYILLSSDGHYVVSHTEDLERVEKNPRDGIPPGEVGMGAASYQLVFVEPARNKPAAVFREAQIRRLPGAKFRALIETRPYRRPDPEPEVPAPKAPPQAERRVWTREDVARLQAELTEYCHASTFEEQVIGRISGVLEQMRSAYRQQADLFDAAQIEQLKLWGHRMDLLTRFLELVEDFDLISDRADFNDAVTELKEIQSEFAGMKLEQRIAREMRALQQQLPRIQAQTRNKGLAAIERQAPKCKNNHPMTLRQGPDNWFWGCSKFPNCRETQELSEEQQIQLAQLNG